MLKKAAILVLIAAIALTSLTACGGSSSGSGGNISGGNPSTEGPQNPSGSDDNEPTEPNPGTGTEPGGTETIAYKISRRAALSEKWSRFSEIYYEMTLVGNTGAEKEKEIRAADGNGHDYLRAVDYSDADPWGDSLENVVIDGQQYSLDSSRKWYTPNGFGVNTGDAQFVLEVATGLPSGGTVTKENKELFHKTYYTETCDVVFNSMVFGELNHATATYYFEPDGSDLKYLVLASGETKAILRVDMISGSIPEEIQKKINLTGYRIPEEWEWAG